MKNLRKALLIVGIIASLIYVPAISIAKGSAGAAIAAVGGAAAAVHLRHVEQENIAIQSLNTQSVMQSSPYDAAFVLSNGTPYLTERRLIIGWCRSETLFGDVVCRTFDEWAKQHGCTLGSWHYDVYNSRATVYCTQNK